MDELRPEAEPLDFELARLLDDEYERLLAAARLLDELLFDPEYELPRDDELPRDEELPRDGALLALLPLERETLDFEDDDFELGLGFDWAARSSGASSSAPRTAVQPSIRILERPLRRGSRLLDVTSVFMIRLLSGGLRAVVPPAPEQALDVMIA